MPAGNFKVKATDRGVARTLTKLRATYSDLSTPLRNAATELTRRIKFRFQFKQDPDGRRWAPWAQSTKKRYAGQRRTLMLHTRALRDGSKFVAGKKDLRAVIGTPYGVFHEQPQRAGNKIPRRAFMFSTRNGKRALAVNDEKYLLNALLYQIRKAAKGAK